MRFYFNKNIFFKSALKYSEVLKEREAQIEMKKLVEKLNKDREEEKEREVLAVLEEKAYKDALKDYKKQEDLDKLTEFHKKQLAAFNALIIIT